MTRDELEVLATVYRNNVDDFFSKEFARVVLNIRSCVSPAFRRSAEGKIKLARLKVIEDQLAEGLITGREACDAAFDYMARGGVE